MTIWNRLTLWAAGSPKGEGEQLALEAVEELERLKQRVAELAYAKEQLELRVLDLIMTRAKNALVTLTGAERAAIDPVDFGGLTDAEREAVCQAVASYEFNDDDEECAAIAATLRTLLERTK